MRCIVHRYFLVALFLGSWVGATPLAAQSSALISAAQGEDLAAVKNALAGGADAKATDENGVPALVWASLNGHMQVVQHLIEQGADPNARAAKAGQTSLMMASWNGHMEVVRYLIEHGADINAETPEQNVALALAFSRGHRNIVMYLIDNGANVNWRATDGGSILTGALKARFYEIAKRALAKGSDVNAQDSSGRTPLMYTAEIGALDIASELLVAGAKVNVQDRENRTALIYAVQAYNGGRFTEERPIGSGITVRIDHLALATELIAKGADVTIKDRSERTALDYANTLSPPLRDAMRAVLEKR